MSPTQNLNMDCSSALLLLLVALQLSHQVACQSGSGSGSELESGSGSGSELESGSGDDNVTGGTTDSESGDDTVTGGITDYLPFQDLGTTAGIDRQCLKRRLDGASPAINIPLGFPIGTSIQSKAYVSSIYIEFKRFATDFFIGWY